MSTIKAVNIQHPSSANTNIVMDANGNMTVAGSVVGRSATGSRNKIINGAMDVWQRGTSGFTTNDTYTADRWWFVNDSVGASSVSRVDVSSLGMGAQYALRAERTSGTNRWVIGTQLETSTVKSLLGKTVTFSCKIRKGSAFTSDITAAVATSGSEAKYSSIVDGSGSITFANSLMNTSTFTTFSYTFNIPASSAALGFKIEFSASQTGASGAYFDVTDVQLEEGSIVTPFERRLYGQELALCQRYYHSTLNSPNGYKVGWMGIGSGNYVIHGVSTFPVPMRINPTITAYAYGLGAGTAQELDGRANVLAKYTFNVGNSYQSHTYGLTPIATHNAIIGFNCGDNSTQYATYSCGYTASAEL